MGTNEQMQRARVAYVKAKLGNTPLRELRRMCNQHGMYPETNNEAHTMYATALERTTTDYHVGIATCVEVAYRTMLAAAPTYLEYPHPLSTVLLEAATCVEAKWNMLGLPLASDYGRRTQLAIILSTALSGWIRGVNTNPLLMCAGASVPYALREFASAMDVVLLHQQTIETLTKE